MRSTFDRRVVAEPVLDLVRSAQRRVACHLGGGAALSAAYLSHRLSADVDLFCHESGEVRVLLGALPDISRESGVPVVVTRDAGHFVRVVAHVPGGASVELDLIEDLAGDLEEPPAMLEGVAVEPLVDLRAAKITCILSRSEPRDLVDLLFLDLAGFPPERDLHLALRKDAGIDPGVLAWLLGQFPVRPLPAMLQPLTADDLLRFRDALRERIRRVSLPETT